MTIWKRMWLWVCGDLCRTCRNGVMRRTGLSGFAILRIHLTCDQCGAQESFTED